MDIITEQLYRVFELIKNNDYFGAAKIVWNMENINNNNLKKYLMIIMDLLGLVTTLTREQIDMIKEMKLEDIKLDNPNTIFYDLTKENEKRKQLYNRQYDNLKNNFRAWDRNIYQDILKTLILLVSAKEKKNDEIVFDLIKNKNYERARVLLENRALRHRTVKEEQIILILLEKLVVLKNSKILPEMNFTETDDYFEAIKNNNFGLTLSLIEKYNRDNKILFNESPIYILVRDICKTLKNIKIYEEYCSKNQVSMIGDSGDSIKNRYEELKKYGLVTIKCKSKNRVAKVLQDIINYPNVRAIVLSDEKTIALKHTPYMNFNNKFLGTIKKADKLSEKRKYKEAIKLYLEILKFEDINSLVYSKIGLCFVGLRNYSKAVEYLTVAMELGKKENRVHDFYSLIAKLEGKIQITDIKPIIKNKDNKFTFDEKYNFGLGDISEVTDAIIMMNLDVETACKILMINEEDIELIKLVYAKEFFSQGEIKLAEKFLKSVEQYENKTPKIIKALEEVKRNRKMYINKKESSLILSLRLIPKK
ncbi:MAG: hypothetical protein J6B98_05690 [Bacilli bacterium]|nr:hypothetical protein [Bacilli bacterium]